MVNMKNYLCFILLFWAGQTYAQQEADIAAALKLFYDATDQTGMVASTEVMQKLSDARPDDWVAAYWTSYFNSQTGRNSNAPMDYYEKAQTYYDRAFSALKEKTAVESSDFHALQSLIYNLTAVVHWSNGDRQNGTQMSQKASAALSQAIKAYDKNPRVYLLTGTDLISNGQRIQNNSWVMAGREMLEKAQELFISEKPASDIAPSWGSGWINFWLNRAQID